MRSFVDRNVVMGRMTEASEHARRFRLLLACARLLVGSTGQVCGVQWFASVTFS
jgi:hypothetical protein